MDKRNNITRLEARIAQLRAELARSRAFYLAGDARALNDAEHAQKLLELEELRADAAMRRAALRERGRASAEHETFARAFMKVAKSRIAPEIYRELIAGTQKKLGIEAAA